MAIFRDSEQFYECVGELMDRAKMDPDVGQKIAKSKIIIQFRYTDPEATTTVDAKSQPSQPSAYVDVIHGDIDLKPDIIMSMKADVAHWFWLGKINLVSALTKGDIKADGPIPKILKLLPAIKPLYKEYPKVLQDKGYQDLLE